MKKLKLFSAISALLISVIPATHASREGDDEYRRRTDRRPSSMAVERDEDAYRVNINSNSGRAVILNYNGQSFMFDGRTHTFVPAPAPAPTRTVAPAAPAPRMMRTVAPSAPAYAATPSHQRTSAPRAGMSSAASTLSSGYRAPRPTATAAPATRYYPGIRQNSQDAAAIRHGRMDSSAFTHVDDVCEMLERFAAKYGLRWTAYNLYDNAQRIAGSSPKDQIRYLIGELKSLPRRLQNTADYEEVLNVLNDIWFLITRSSPLKNDAWRYVCQMFRG